MPKSKQTPLERLLLHSNYNNENGCLEWQHCLDGAGYGLVFAYGKKHRVHRLHWSIVNGDIPEGMFICHKCDNRKCLNLDHLFLGTHKDNMQDALKKGRLVIPTCNNQGERHPHVKLTDKKVIQIRKERTAKNSTLLSIAKKYGVSESQIHNIVNRKKWKHI